MPTPSSRICLNSLYGCIMNTINRETHMVATPESVPDSMLQSSGTARLAWNRQ